MNCMIKFHNLQEVCKYSNIRFSDSNTENVCMMNTTNTLCDIDNCPYAERMNDDE